MRRRALVAAVVAVLAILAGRAALRAQHPSRPPLLAVQEAGKTKVRNVQPEMPPGLPSADEPIPGPAGPAPMALPGPVEPNPSPSDDPMGVVETFVRRNRKEADDSIQALSREAESLRARLQKVEAALARWQGVAEALNPEGNALRWAKPEPEVPQLEAIKAPADAGPNLVVPPPGVPLPFEEPKLGPIDPGLPKIPAPR